MSTIDGDEDSRRASGVDLEADADERDGDEAGGDEAPPPGALDPVAGEAEQRGQQRERRERR